MGLVHGTEAGEEGDMTATCIREIAALACPDEFCVQGRDAGAPGFYACRSCQGTCRRFPSLSVECECARHFAIFGRLLARCALCQGTSRIPISPDDWKTITEAIEAQGYRPKYTKELGWEIFDSQGGRLTGDEGWSDPISALHHALAAEASDAKLAHRDRDYPSSQPPREQPRSLHGQVP